MVVFGAITRNSGPNLLWGPLKITGLFFFGGGGGGGGGSLSCNRKM